MNARPMTDNELKKAMMQRWHECQKANSLYYRAREKALEGVNETLEPLRFVCDEAVAAYKVLQAEFMERTRRTP